MTQEQKVIKRLDEYGEVDNFWAIHNFMLRLGATIHDLREKGWEFDTYWGEGSEKKNFHYKAIKKPNPITLKML